MEDCKFFLICLMTICYAVTSRSQTAEGNECHPKIPCDNWQCIEVKQWCDGETNCDDWSDEEYCRSRWFSSCDKSRYFICSNKKCVPLALKCDGIDNCGDNSDEDHCEESVKDDFFPSLEGFNNSELTGNGNSSPTLGTPESNINFPTSAPPRGVIVQTPVRVSVDHYDIRRQEMPNQRTNVHYRPNERDHRDYNRGSDTVPSYHFPDNRRTPPSRYTPYENQDPLVPPTTSWNTPRASINFSGCKQWPVIDRPRPVIYSHADYPGNSQVSNSKKRHRIQPLPPFHFEKDDEYFRNFYSSKVMEAEHWILGQIDSSYGWGKDTPRALVALSLIRNSFFPNITEYDLMRRRLKLDLGGKLLREEPLSDTRLAMYINALMATCQDPKQTFDKDLVEMLYTKTHSGRQRRGGPSPFVYLTLCLTNRSVTHQELSFLVSIVSSPITDEVSKDRFILATTALACFEKVGKYGYEVTRLLENTARKLYDQQLDDGSFGSIYSTALAAQAFFAIDFFAWDPELTLNFLSDHQIDGGSFGDMLATYYTLPALSGRSLVHLRNTRCERPYADDESEKPSPEDEWNRPGPRKSILYSLAVGCQQRRSLALNMTVPADANFFEIMQMAQKLDTRFKFLYVESLGKIDVYTISDIPNNPERGMYWNLYVLNGRNHTVDINRMHLGDVRSLVPEDSQELLYWHLPFNHIFPEDRI